VNKSWLCACHPNSHQLAAYSDFGIIEQIDFADA
jgi:hypothetical protein